MKNLRSVAVFCGSSDGASEKYMRLASSLGGKCAENSLSVYYGGAKLGLMGAVAEAALQKNGKVIGIMPDFFADDVVSAKNLSEMVYVKSMSERKQLMERLADAFITLPGSFGTMDELFEIIVDAQLGIHHKPIVLLNHDGYYDALLSQIQHFLDEGFLRPFHRSLILTATTVDEVFTCLENFEYQNDSDWIGTYTKRK